MTLKVGINKLNTDVVNKIIAGEVIESPTSVIKELIENSIDANSKNISIYIEDYGLKYIMVVDDGKGMSFEDACICFQRHTTSKIMSYNDLKNINTLGFRGEALSSICSISKCKIVTKEEQSQFGISLVIDNENIIEKKIVASKKGTTLIVSDLFYNLQDKKKYLNNKNIEISEILMCINTLSLVYNNLNITLYNNNNKILYYHAETLLESITNVFGFLIAKHMIRLDYEDNESIKKYIKIAGYISNPMYGRSNPKNIFFSVNKRPLKSKILIQCVQESYSSYSPKKKYPFIVLNIEVPSSTIDINRDPKKNSIKFEDEQYILSKVKEAIQDTLSKINKELSFKKTSYDFLLQKYSDIKLNLSINTCENDDLKNNYENDVELKLKKSQNLIDRYSLNFKNSVITELFSNIKIIGQIFKLYLVLEKLDQCILIDQHALHEKIIYSQLKKITNSTYITLENPILFFLSRKEMILIELYKDELKTLGFEINNFGMESYIITKIPLYLINEIGDSSNTISNLIIEIINNNNIKNIDIIKDEIFKKIACKSSIKSGEKCTERQIEILLNQAIKIQDPVTCPHGRPTILIIDKINFDKSFKRSYKSKKNTLYEIKDGIFF